MVVFYRVILWAIFFVCSVQIQAATHHLTVYRNVWMPTYHGQRLNYCSLDRKACGLALASRYCQLLGYHRATYQRIAYHVTPTRFLPSNAICRGLRCNSFKTIRCVAHRQLPAQPYHYRLKKFVFPRFTRCRLDWCYDGHQGCGWRAAYSFCRRMGYMQVKQFEMAKHLALTQAISNQRICKNNHCKGFHYITCFR